MPCHGLVFLRRNAYSQAGGKAVSSDSRFWCYVGKSGACWIWLGAKDLRGYGRWRIPGTKKTALAHRVSFAAAHGYEPEAVCHTCDNPSCVNPAHLFGGTRAANNADMIAKGRHAAQTGALQLRHARGRQHPGAKLSDTDVSVIRRRAMRGEKQREIAKSYGVSQRTVCKVVNRLSWSHVESVV